MCVCSESQEQAQHKLTALDQEIEKQTVQQREWQLKELVKLRQQLHMPEREKQQMHLQEVRMQRHLLVPAGRHAVPRNQKFFSKVHQRNSLVPLRLFVSALTNCRLLVSILTRLLFH